MVIEENLVTAGFGCNMDTLCQLDPLGRSVIYQNRAFVVIGSVQVSAILCYITSRRCFVEGFPYKNRLLSADVQQADPCKAASFLRAASIVPSRDRYLQSGAL